MDNEGSKPLVTALHPKVIDAANKAIAEAKARGLNVGIHSGLRTSEEQNRLYALGRYVINPDGKSAEKPFGNVVTNAQAYESWHCLGLAVDLVFRHDHSWTWAVPQATWDELGNIGKMFGFEWGGDWSKFPDLPHFQMRGKIPNVREAKRILFEKGCDELWKLV